MCAKKRERRQEENPAGERLQKVLAHAGVASRRASEEYILQGRVRVNGEIVRELGTRVRPGIDRIELDGRPVDTTTERLYYLLYKPTGYLSTTTDPHGGHNVMELVPQRGRLYPVGRLDLESEGLLLLTNDGALTERLTHPRYEHAKEYMVLVRGRISLEDIEKLESGVLLEDEDGEEEERLARARVSRMASGWTWRDEPTPRGYRWVRFVLKEGRKRQIRRMLETVGYRVARLIRVRMGTLRLGDLEPGQGRWLSAEEVSELRRSVGLESGRRAKGRSPQDRGRDRAQPPRRTGDRPARRSGSGGKGQPERGESGRAGNAPRQKRRSPTADIGKRRQPTRRHDNGSRKGRS